MHRIIIRGTGAHTVLVYNSQGPRYKIPREGKTPMSVTPENKSNDSNRHMLRHAVATLAYRGGKTLRDAPGEFAQFHAAETCRTPAQILAHLGDVLDWALTQAKGTPEYQESAPLPWDQATGRFFASLKAFDDYLASDAPLRFPAEKLFQGPIADALTHVGQIAIIRRLAGAPIKGENYVAAEIVAGRVGQAQAAPRREF
jgi:hypothetical protein